MDKIVTNFDDTKTGGKDSIVYMSVYMTLWATIAAIIIYLLVHLFRFLKTFSTIDMPILYRDAVRDLAKSPEFGKFLKWSTIVIGLVILVFIVTIMMDIFLYHVLPNIIDTTENVIKLSTWLVILFMLLGFGAYILKKYKIVHAVKFQIYDTDMLLYSKMSRFFKISMFILILLFVTASLKLYSGIYHVLDLIAKRVV
jgi:hypothetical protein